MAVCACASTSAHADSPKRIGSTSLCGDAYLLELKPDGLAALSWQSRDKVSRASIGQRTLPQIWDDPEVLLSSGLTHIVFGPGEGARSRAFLPENIQTSQLVWGHDFETVKNNFKTLGARLGKSADDNIYALTDRLAALQPPNTRPKVLYLARDGSSSGPGTFVDAVIEAAGGVNIIGEAGWQKPDLEYLLGLKPDLIVTSYFDDGYESANAAPVRHQAMRDYINAHARVEIPGALWPCAGPGLIEAAEILHAKIKALP